MINVAADISSSITLTAEAVCGYPLFVVLIGGGLYLLLSSRFVSLRCLPYALRELREKGTRGEGQISSVQALASAVAATIGLGNIAGVAIALVMGGPGAIFWMWVSAIVGMATKYHEGTLSIMFRGSNDMGAPQGGTMHIIERGLGRKWMPLARFFAVATLFGTLGIMNSNQLTEAVISTFSLHEYVKESGLVATVSNVTGLPLLLSLRFIIGIAIASAVALVILGGIRRIARVASLMVPFMVAVYLGMVLYIIIVNYAGVPAVFHRIVSEAFNLDAGIGALAGVAVIGARRAAFVNDAGVGTATIMHGASANDRPVREGLIAMLGPSIDSGLVCTLTAVAILLCGNIDSSTLRGLDIATEAFRNAIPGGEYLLMVVVACFAMSSLFSYSFYGTTCASYLFGSRLGRHYRIFFILTLIVFAVVPIEAAVGLCDLFYAFMAFPTMFAVITLSGKVRAATKEYISQHPKKSSICLTT